MIGMGLLALFGSPARAVDFPDPTEATNFLAPKRIADLHPRWTVEHRREALWFGGLQLWPALTVGPVLDTNPFQQHRPGRQALGVRLSPAILMERESGPHRLTAYATGDLRFYPADSATNVQSGRAGILHDWEIRRDLVLRMQGDVARRTDPFNNASLIAPGGARRLIEETDLLGSASIQKSFGRLFATMSGTVLRSGFQASRTVREAAGGVGLSDETVLTLKGRVGYLFPSSLYVFAEPAANWRLLDRLDRPSTGTRAVAGVGVARLGLLGGELFAGRQEQTYRARGETVSTAVVGGRLAWTPTRAWTLAVQADQGLGDVAIGTIADPLGTPVRSTTVQGSLRCAPSPLWSARAEGGAVWQEYVGTRRRDQLTFAGLRVDYAVSRRIDLTGLFQIGALRSNVAGAGYRKAVTSLAATYHY